MFQGIRSQSYLGVLPIPITYLICCISFHSWIVIFTSEIYEIITITLRPHSNLIPVFICDRDWPSYGNYIAIKILDYHISDVLASNFANNDLDWILEDPISRDRGPPFALINNGAHPTLK